MLLENLTEAGIHYLPDFINELEEKKLLEHVYTAPKPKWHRLLNRRLQNWGGMVGGNQCLIQDEPLPTWLEECIDKIMSIEDSSNTTCHIGECIYKGFPENKRPNHVLVNEYLPGQGIMPHTDGPAFFPLISTITLGSHTILDLYKEEKEQSANNCEPVNDQNLLECIATGRQLIGSLLLEPRSLVLISGQAYRLLHGIADRIIDKIPAKQILNWNELGQKPSLQRINEDETSESSAVDAELLMTRGTRVSLTIRNVPNVKKFKLMLGGRR